MCGIAGIINKNSNEDQAIDPHSQLEEMLNSISHRGPDDCGEFHEGDVHFGHRRLSILDLSDRGHQPMSLKDVVIILNGEIYNYLELKQELSDLGHSFHSDSDTEVLLHAYDEWGIDCLSRLTGMWAFALFDKKKNVVHFSRDRFGIKPFYYFQDQQTFIFASEIKALLKAEVQPVVNKKILASYLVVGLTEYSNETFFKNIYQLQPAERAEFNLETQKFEIFKYYDLDQAAPPLVDGDTYRERFKRSVQLHLRSDVPVGTCLSGGLDSSTVAALAGKEISDTGGKFTAITAKSETKENDESEYARQVAEHAQLNWEVVCPNYEEFDAEIEKCLYFQDEPCLTPSVFMQYSVMKRAKELGLKVMLDGQGGDESLLGYDRYYAAYFWDLFKKLKWRKLFTDFFRSSRESGLSVKQVFAYTVYFLVLPLRKAVLRKRVPFLSPAILNLAFDELKNQGSDFFNLRKLQVTELTVNQLTHLLHYEDRNSMAHSIEARVPFIEHHLIEAAVALPPEEKIHRGFKKYALRVLTETCLPESIAWRRKKYGFEAPTTHWYREHREKIQNELENSTILREICKAIPKVEQLQGDVSWRFYCVAVWERLFNVQFSEVDQLQENRVEKVADPTVVTSS